MNPLIGPLVVNAARRSAHSARPGAPVVPDSPARPPRLRLALAAALRRAADRLDHGTRGPIAARSAGNGPCPT